MEDDDKADGKKGEERKYEKKRFSFFNRARRNAKALSDGTNKASDDNTKVVAEGDDVTTSGVDVDVAKVNEDLTTLLLMLKL